MVHEDIDIGRCIKCNLMQYMDACNHELVVHLVAKSRTGTINLQAFGSIVREIAGKDVEQWQHS